MSNRRLGERLTEDPLRELLREVVERRLGLGHRGLHAGARQRHGRGQRGERRARQEPGEVYRHARGDEPRDENHELARAKEEGEAPYACLLYTSPSPRDAHESRMPSSA